MSFFDSSNINKVGSIVSKDAPLPDPVIPESVPNETVIRNPPSITTSPKLPTGSIGEMGASEPSSKPINNTNSMKEEEILIAVSDIDQDDDTFRCRKGECNKTIKKYTENAKEYKESKDKGENPPYPFPPILVLKRGERYILVAGYHRIAAARQAGIDKILVRVLVGTVEEAIWQAITDNQHGLPLKDGDLKHCIIKALKRCPGKSQGAIATGLSCARSYVSKIAKQLVTCDQLTVPEKQTGRDGKTRRTTRRQSAAIPNKDSDKDATPNQQSVDVQKDMPQPTKPDKDSGQIGVNNYYDCKLLCDKGTFDGRKLHRETLELEAAVDGLSRADTLFTETLEAARVCHDLNNAIDALSKHADISIESLKENQLTKQKVYATSHNKLADVVKFIGDFEKIYEALLKACATTDEQGLLIEIQQKFYEQRTAFYDSYRRTMAAKFQVLMVTEAAPHDSWFPPIDPIYSEQNLPQQ